MLKQFGETPTEDSDDVERFVGARIEEIPNVRPCWGLVNDWLDELVIFDNFLLVALSAAAKSMTTVFDEFILI